MVRKIAGAINGFLGEIEGFQHKLGPTVSSLTIDLQAWLFLSHKLAKFAFNIPHDKLSKIQPFIKEIAIPSIEVLKSNLADTMEVIFHTLMRDEQSQYREVKLRLTRQVLVTADWQDRIIPASQKLVKMMRKIAGALNGFLGEIESLSCGILKANFVSLCDRKTSSPFSSASFILYILFRIRMVPR